MNYISDFMLNYFFSYLIKIVGNIESKTNVPAITIISSIGMNADKYVPNGTNITVAKRIKEAIN